MMANAVPRPARDAVDAYEQTGDLAALEQGIRFTRAAVRQAMTVAAGEQVALRIDLAVLLSIYGNAVGDGDAIREGLCLFAQAAAAANGAAEAAARQASRSWRIGRARWYLSMTGPAGGAAREGPWPGPGRPSTLPSQEPSSDPTRCRR
jgi:hypothetical protein